MIEESLKRIANYLDLIGMNKYASEVDNILNEFNQRKAANAFDDVELIVKHFGEKGLKKAWRDDNIYKTSSVKVIEKKKQEYLQDYYVKHS